MDEAVAWGRSIQTALKAYAAGELPWSDVDSLPGRDAVTHRHADRDPQVVSVLIAELDDAEGREGIVVIAASNHPGKLDPALLRSGRLDRHIRIRLPKAPALALILREHLGDELGDVSLSVPPCMPLVRPVPIVSVSSEVHGGGHERRDV